MKLEEQIKDAIFSTLVVENKGSVGKYCVPKIIQILVDRGYIANDPDVRVCDEIKDSSYENRRNIKIGAKDTRSMGLRHILKDYPE